MLALKYGELVYYGQWFAPELREAMQGLHRHGLASQRDRQA